MEAKDTLMTFAEQNAEMNSAKIKPGCLVRKQAEVSFKAGADEESKLCIKRCAMAHQAGIREVAEWICEQIAFEAMLPEWQTKLEEWGIIEEQGKGD